jgi:hypothetical protein
MEDILAMTQGRPIKAFPGQDHKSHVEFKMTWVQDPLVGGKSPTMQQLVPQVMSNIREHQVLQLQEQISGATQDEQGKSQNGQPLDPKVLAQLQAQAFGEVTKANSALSSMLGGDDPMHMVAQAEMLKAQTEAKRVSHVKVKDLAELSLKAQQLDIDRFLAQVKGKEVNMDAQLNQFKQGLEAVRAGIDNLMNEAKATGMEQENKIKQKGMAHDLAINAIGKAQDIGAKHVEHNLKLQHTKETNDQKTQFQKKAFEQKLAQQRMQALIKARSKT